MAKKRTKRPAFDVWWTDPKRPDVASLSPFEVARMAFAAGRGSVPKSPRIRKALAGLLDLLEDWDAGFDGFGEVNAAERALGLPESHIR